MKAAKLPVVALLAPLGVWCIMLTPVLTTPGVALQTEVLFPRLTSAVEGMTFFQMGLFVVAGFVVGLIGGRHRRPDALGFGCIGGALAVLWLPAAACVEMVRYPSTHNLFPFEFAIYAFYGLLVCVGIWLGQAAFRLSGLSGGAG